MSNEPERRLRAAGRDALETIGLGVPFLKHLGARGGAAGGDQRVDLAPSSALGGEGRVVFVGNAQHYT